MVLQETGWDSGKPGYDGLIEVANRLMIGRTNSEAKEASVCIMLNSSSLPGNSKVLILFIMS